MDKISRTKTDLLMREWEEMVRECRSNGLTVKEWCINTHMRVTFYMLFTKSVILSAICCTP